MASAATRQRALQSRARWNPAVSASGGGVRAASRWLVRLAAIPLNTARPSADPSWKEAVIRAAANPAWFSGTPAFAAVCTPAYSSPSPAPMTTSGASRLPR